MHVLYKHLLIERGWVRRKRRGWHLGKTTWLALRTLNSFKISHFRKSLLHLYCSDRIGRDKVPSDHRRHHVAPVTNCHLLDNFSSSVGCC